MELKNNSKKSESKKAAAKPSAKKAEPKKAAKPEKVTPIKANYSKETTRMKGNMPTGFSFKEIDKSLYSSFMIESPVYTLRILNPKHIQDPEIAKPLIQTGSFHLSVLIGDTEVKDVSCPADKLTEIVQALASTLYEPLVKEAKKIAS